MSINILFLLLISMVIGAFIISCMMEDMRVLIIASAIGIFLCIPISFIEHKFDNIRDKISKIIETDITTIVNKEENKNLTKEELVDEIEEYLEDLKIDGNRISIVNDEKYRTLDSNNINIDYTLKIEDNIIYEKEVVNIRIDDKNNEVNIEVRTSER